MSKTVNFTFIGDFKAGDFPNQFLYPTSDWNYALNLDENNISNSVEVIKKTTSNFPWKTENTQVILKVKASKVKNWTLDGTKHAPVYPKNLVIEDDEEILELVPLGSTYLRTTIFPKTKN